MGRRCCVPHCYTGYRKSKDRAEKETGSLFKVPDDDYFREEWNKAIAREDRLITPKDFVCFKHFGEDDFIKRRYVKNAVEEYKVPKLKPDAIPSIFPDLPDHILKMCKKRRKMPMPIKSEDIKLEENVESNMKNNNDVEKESDISSEKMDEDTFVPEILVQIKDEPLDMRDYAESSTEHTNEITTGEIEIKTEIQEEDADTNTGPKMYKCDECDYQSIYKNNIKTHKTKHEQEYKYVCEHCPKFRTKWIETYKSHLRVKHNIGPQKIYTCSLCTFKSKIQVCWRRHMDRHKKMMGYSRYMCDVCPFKSDSHKSFQHHMKEHKSDPILNHYPEFGLFDVLNQSFVPLNDNRLPNEIEEIQIKQEPNMNFEKKDHSGPSTIIDLSNNNFMCEDCSFTTHSEESLQVHQKVIHSKLGTQKLLKCAECDFTSRTILCLKLHMKKH